ncbi:hypothetical protein BsWGS_00923 [Bradybaena similaris]
MKMTGTGEHFGTSRFVAFSEMNLSELNIVSIDHCYCKPWSSHPDANYTRPLHMLFMETFPHSSQEKLRPTDVIDVVGNDDNIPCKLNTEKVEAVLSDHGVSHPDYADDKDDWEDHITSLRSTWSVLQNRIFAKVMRVLQADRLARLSVQGIINEAVQRRLQIDKAARRVRFCFGNVGWDMALIMWLHNLLLENLKGQLLTSYLEVLLTLKLTIPSLVKHLIEGVTSRQGLALESVSEFSKINWDSLLSNANLQKIKRLPDNPVLLIISTTPSSPAYPVENKRHKLWQHQLSAMGKVISVVPDNTNCSTQASSFVESMFTTTRAKILEVKSHFAGRPIILIGWHIGALVAAHVAAVELVSGVVCLGFPTNGIYGDRGELEDPIYACKTPTLFVVGQHASTSSIDILENIREKLKVETSLLLIGGADDQLRISHAKKLSCNVTQTMVDRYIMDEMFAFLGSILSQRLLKSEVTEETEIIRKQRKRKHKSILASCSQTGSTSKQLPMKTVRSLKIGNGGTLSFGIPRSMAGVTKIVKKATAKKHSKEAYRIDSSTTPSKKRMLHLTFPVFEASNDQARNISKVNEAAAIASAPELSNLLQSIHNPGQHKLTSDNPSFLMNKISTTSSSADSSTTTTLTLSRFLTSSGSYRTGALSKTQNFSADDVETVGSKSNIGAFKEETLNEHQKYLDSSSVKQQSQILVRTGTSVPFSIPLTFTMTGKVLKSSPVMKVTGNNSELLHDQQLSKSVSGLSLSLNAIQSSSANQVSTVSTTSFVCSSSPSFNSLSPVNLRVTTSCNSTQVNKSVSTTNLPSVTPAASVIHIGSDTVFMKETFPSSTSVPGTVSIDLGQIATGSSGGNVMTLATVPKISLIPTVKQIAIPELTERLMLASSATRSPPATTALTSSSQFHYSQMGKPTTVSQAMTSLKSSILLSSELSKTVSVSESPASMMTVPSSCLLTNLSSSTGLIALKLSPQSDSSLTTAVNMTAGNNYMQAQDNATFLTQKKEDNLKSSDISSSIRILNTVSTQAVEPERQQKLHFVSCTSSVTFSPSSASLIIAPGNITGQSMLQCQRTLSNSVQSTVASSPLMNISASTDSVGQVASLFESSPITMEEKQTLETSGFESLSSSEKQITKFIPPALPSLTLASSSSFITHDLSSLKSSKSVVSSYTATSKPVLPSVASTRTRRIKTPKQYDL